MNYLKRLPLLSTALITIIFCGFILVGCEKEEQATDQKVVTSASILNGNINPAELSYDEKILFLEKHVFTESGMGPETNVDLNASHLVLKELSIEEIFKELEKKSYFQKIEDVWRAAITTKKTANLYPKKIHELTKEESEDFFFEIEELLQQKENYFSFHSYKNMSACSSYYFGFKAHRSNTFNRNAFFVDDASNEGSSDCDYMVCFAGYGEGLYANTVLMKSIITSHYPWGFEGYDKIIIRKSRNRTYVLFGSLRVAARLSINSIFNYKNYLKTHVKLKV